jgi:hypothetical protein
MLNRITPAAQRAARTNLRVARKVWVARTDERAAKLAPIITALRAKGITSLKGIAAALNKRRIRTARQARLGSLVRWQPRRHDVRAKARLKVRQSAITNHDVAVMISPKEEAAECRRQAAMS